MDDVALYSLKVKCGPLTMACLVLHSPALLASLTCGHCPLYSLASRFLDVCLSYHSSHPHLLTLPPPRFLSQNADFSVSGVFHVTVGFPQCVFSIFNFLNVFCLLFQPLRLPGKNQVWCSIVSPVKPNTRPCGINI